MNNEKFNGVFFVAMVDVENDLDIKGCIGALPVFENIQAALRFAGGDESKIGILESRNGEYVERFREEEIL